MALHRGQARASSRVERAVVAARLAALDKVLGAAQVADTRELISSRGDQVTPADERAAIDRRLAALQAHVDAAQREG
jgi:hypothetical protein